MVNSKNGGNRLAVAISENGTGSVISFNRASYDRRDHLPDIAPVCGDVPAKARRASSTRTSNGTSPHQGDCHAERLGELDVSEVVKQVFQAESRALQAVPSALAPGALERIGAALINARRIWCYATGRSRLLASEAEYQFVRLGLRCVSSHDCMQLAIQTTLLSLEDVVLAFSYSGRDRQTVGGLALARRTGALTIGITNEPDSPLTKQSDIALVLPKRDEADDEITVHSKIPELTLIHALATCIAMCTSQKTAGANRCDEFVAKVLIR